MAIQKKITIDGQEVVFKASAAIPRIYRLKYGRDIFKDLSKLETGVKENNEGQSTLDIESLELFENIAFVMAKHADPNICEDTSEWLEQFNTFSIYQVLPQLIELWGLNVKSESEQRKKYKPPKGK
ncbi:hypothetical protein [Facklamia lactis]|uniref:hypothetical protein n=1 Tax=Facklamia lactis TaxID=2749967 RepID=UPI0018CF6F5E|nr:hypothetical protein [Facklamia lactis]MBG9980442.1 hypothetical protein [Facklamia lactis]